MVRFLGGLLLGIFITHSLGAQPFQVFPPRVVFLPDDEVQTLTLISKSSDTLLLKSQFVERLMDTTGKLRPVDTLPQGCPASAYVKVFPFQVLLPPHAKASVRLMKTAPLPLRDIPECRSHLLITPFPLSPSVIQSQDTSRSSGLQIQLYAVVRITIPVFLFSRPLEEIPVRLVPLRAARHGDTLTLELIRQGARSISAELRVFLPDTTLIQKRGFYSPTQRFYVSWVLPSLSIPDTLSLRITDRDTHARHRYTLPLEQPRISAYPSP